jgi:hypothetical protein
MLIHRVVDAVAFGVETPAELGEEGIVDSIDEGSAPFGEGDGFHERESFEGVG